MIEYGGIMQPSFLKVTGVEVSMPEVDMQTMTVPKKLGAVFYGYELGGRTVSLDVTLVKPPYRTLQDIEIELAKWLFPYKSGTITPFNDLQKLYLENDKSKYLLVRLSNTVSIKDIVKAGEGTLEFYSPSPFYYDTLEVYDTRTLSSSGTSNNITYNGSYDVYPYEITVTMNATVSGLTIRNQDVAESLTINKSMVSGDVVKIYPNKRQVFINGEYAMKYVAIGSRFPILLANKQNTFVTTLASGQWELKSNILYL
jgi:predicted phage tail component-like protein